MKRNSIKWKFIQNFMIMAIIQIVLITVIFNITIRFYMEKNIRNQLSAIASNAEETILHTGPDLLPPPPFPKPEAPDFGDNNDLLKFYFLLDHSLREPLSLLNADYILLDSRQQKISTPVENSFRPSEAVINKITDNVKTLENPNSENYINVTVEGKDYTAIIKPFSKENPFGLGWIVIYSSLEKINQLLWGLQIILFLILLLSSLFITLFSSRTVKKISVSLASLNQHIKAISERNFGEKIQVPVYEEFQEFISNINTMSEKLDVYDKAQKTFLQNASHEFRTPLMSIQSYSEGILHKVTDSDTAADIILQESKRITRLVEDLLYLSRLDAIEENYSFSTITFNPLMVSCIKQMQGIANKNDIKIILEAPTETINIVADEEKLSRAITNILSNCIRYADRTIKVNYQRISEDEIELSISDDGPGIATNSLPNIFDRFYKGTKGNFGLGLAISKNIIEKHDGKITAENLNPGASFRIILPKINPKLS